MVKVNSSSLDSRKKSPYLWSKDLVFPLNKQVEPNDLWDTTKLSKVLNHMAKTCMGTEMNVSSWHHIAIVISCRFLKWTFTDPTDYDNNDDDNDDVDIADVAVNGRSDRNRLTTNVNSAYNLQASHSVCVNKLDIWTTDYQSQQNTTKIALTSSGYQRQEGIMRGSQS
jgi:hypothetical protein